MSSYAESVQNERSAACSAVYEFDRRIRIRRETETPREEHPPLIIKSYMRRKLFEERPPGPRTVLALHISLSPPSALHLPTTTDHIGLLDLTSLFLLLLLTWLPNQKRKEKRHIHPGKPKPQLSTLNFLIFTYILEPGREYAPGMHTGIRNFDFLYFLQTLQGG